jgi:polar amino acid transport system substrate-binding protein
MKKVQHLRWGTLGRRAMMTTFALALTLGAAMPERADARSLEEAKASGKLIVGVSGDNPPFGFIDTSGTQKGYDAEIAEAFAKSLGLQVQYAQLSLAARIPSLLAQKVDILIAGLGMTEERAKSVQFTVPYLETKMYVVGNKDTKITSPADLASVSVGTPRSSTLDTLLSAVAPKSTDIRRFDDDSATIQSLLSGQVTAIAANQFAVDRLESLAPGTYENKIVIGGVWYGAATRPGEKDWNKAFNDFFQSYKTTDEYRALFKKWIKNDVPDFPTELKGITFAAQ